MSLQRVLLILLKYALALIYGTLVLFRIAIMIIRHPRRTFASIPRPIPPKVLEDPTLGQHHFIHLKDRGIKIHYVSNGSSESPLMLFVHGFPEFWYSWRHQMREFSKDYFVVAIDQRGYGESDKPSGVSSYHIDEMTADLKALIPALGFSSATVVAHDWGSPIVWNFAAKHPDLVDKMVHCNGPNPTAFTKKVKEHFDQFLKSWYIFFFQCPILPEFLMSANDFAALKTMFTESPMGCKRSNALSTEDIEAYVYTFQKNGFEKPINYYRAVEMKTKEDLKKQSEEIIEIPTLIIWGTADGALDRSLASDAAKLHRNCLVKFIEGASHWVQQDEPGLVNEHMKAFLRGGELRHK